MQSSICHELWLADDHPCPVNGSDNAEATQRREVARSDQNDLSLFGTEGYRLADWMFRRCLDRSHEQQKTILRLVGVDIGEGHRSSRQGAGLVEDDGVDDLRLFEDLSVLEQHSKFGAASRADHDRSGGGQTHGARTGDDQDGHRRAQRHCYVAGGDQPPGQRQ